MEETSLYRDGSVDVKNRAIFSETGVRPVRLPRLARAAEVTGYYALTLTNGCKWPLAYMPYSIMLDMEDSLPEPSVSRRAGTVCLAAATGILLAVHGGIATGIIEAAVGHVNDFVENSFTEPLASMTRGFTD